MFKRLVYLLVVLSIAGSSFGQQPAHIDPELKELIRRAVIRMGEYKTGFKDLIAEEDQKIEEFDQHGKLEKQRRIVSDLVIYQSQLDPTQMVEYRDVKSVDGVAI